MKKFYSLAIAAIAACSAWAAPGFTYVGPVEAKAKTQNPTELKANLKVAEGRTLSDVPVQNTKKTQSVDTKAISLWNPVEGTGTFSDDAITTFVSNAEPREWEVTIEKHRVLDIYRIQDPYANDPDFGSYCTADATRYMYINCTDPNNVYFCDANGDYAVYDTGITLGSNGNLEISTYAWYMNANGREVEAGMGGVFKNGVISFPDQTLIAHFTNFQNGQWQFANPNKQMRIKLPGAKDYSITMTSTGHCVHGDVMKFAVSFGPDVTAAKYKFLPGPYANAGWEANIAAEGYEFTVESGAYTYPNEFKENSGVFLMIVTLDETGAYQEAAMVEFALDGDDDNWETFANPGHLYEGTLSVGYGFDALDYDVTVQRNKTNNDFYRIVNPFTNGSWTPAENADVCQEGNHYFYINATNPQQVYVEASATGVSFDDGSIMLNSWGYIGQFYTFEGASFVYGTMDDNGLITLEGNAIGFNLQRDPGNMYAVRTASTKLQLPENRDLAGISEVANDAIDANAPVEYYNLQGIRILNVENNPGLYIRKQGNKTSKVYMK